VESSKIYKILDRLECVFLNTPLSKPGAKQEYVKFFFTCDYDVAEKTIDKIILDGTKFFPTISEINALYKNMEAIELSNKKFNADGNICMVCNGDGFIVHKIKTIDYVLYCTECEKGRDFKYDGRNNSKNAKSIYYTEPVTKFYDVNQLTAENSFKDRQPIKAPEYIRKLLDKLSRRMAV
jgi:excinuclease UvrABC ATPase subunit